MEQYPSGWQDHWFRLRKRNSRLAHRYLEVLDAEYPSGIDGWLGQLIDMTEQIYATIQKPGPGFKRVLFNIGYGRRDCERPRHAESLGLNRTTRCSRPRERRARTTRRTRATASASSSSPDGSEPPPPLGGLYQQEHGRRPVVAR